MSISFGDTVRIISAPETIALGVAGKTGQVYGETTPSVTAVDVVGQLTEDFAINVCVSGVEEQYWFAPNLLEFVDHSAGTEIIIGNSRAVRRADGSWEESKINAGKTWWQFWR
jgi:hypothetical protein